MEFVERRLAGVNAKKPLVRTVSIPIYNNEKLEVFTRPRGGLYDGFEVWMVGICNGERAILDHFMTHENLERRLSYAHAGDLAWSDVKPSALPTQKTHYTEETQGMINRGKFLDLERMIYYFNALNWVNRDRKVCNVAKKTIVGRWTDGIATIVFSPESRLRISCPAAASHPLYSAAHEYHADWWNFARWMLVMLNNKKKSGERTGVFRCDDRELHITSNLRDTLVHVFYREPALRPLLS